MAQTATVGSYGTFAIDAAGAWTYTATSAHDEFVAGSTYTDTFAVASADGTATSVTVNILGTNDAAVLSADSRNLTETNAAADISTSGTLTISDVDSAGDASWRRPAPPARYGTFAIDADGAWTYTASSAHNEFVAGTTYTDTFAVASADGTADLGDDQHPRHQRRGGGLSSDVRNLTETNAAADISTTGTLTISDVDSAGNLRGADRHGRHLRHLRDRRRRRLDLHGELGAQRVRGRHHLHRHLRGGERRRHDQPRSPSTSSAPTTQLR